MHTFRNILILFIILFTTVACDGVDLFDSKGSSSTKNFTVSFDVNDGILSSPATLIVKAGNLVAEPTPPTKVGYLFTEWQLDGGKYDFNTPVTENITLVAIWEILPPLTYTVTFNVDGGTPQPGSLSVNHGDKVSVPTSPTKSGYDFKGWERNGTVWNFATDEVVSDITLTAKWEVIPAVITYSVTFNADGGAPQPASLSVNSGDKISAPVAPTKAGNTFKGWERNGAVWNFATDVVVSNITLTAKWEVIPAVITYSVTFNVDGGTPQPESLSVNSGGKISAPVAPTKAGNTFKGWEFNGAVWNFATDVVVSNITLTAKWEVIPAVITYSVTFNVDGGAPQPASLSVNSGDKIPAPTEPTKAGNTFKGWERNGTVWNFATDVVVSNITLTAKWEIIAYTVTFNAEDGAPQPTSLSVNYGDKISEPVEPTKAGHTFQGWQLNGGIYNFDTAVVSDILLTAKWEIIAYTVTFNVDGGAPQLANLSVNYGDKISAPTEPTKAGHTFQGWQLNGGIYNFDTAVVSDILLTAKWEIIAYTVTFNAEGGAPQPESSSVNHGDKVSEPTPPTKDTFVFTEWQLDGVEYNFNTPVTGDITLNAVWSALTVTLANPQTFSMTTMPGAEGRDKDYLLEISSPTATIESATTTIGSITVTPSGRTIELIASTYSGVIASQIEVTVKVTGSTALYTVQIPIHLETGEVASPYIISSEGDLRAIGTGLNNLDKHYELGDNIGLDVAKYGVWVPIGSTASSSFTGSMDGKGYKISNLTIDSSTARHYGLFGYMSGGTLSNIHLVAVDIKMDVDSNYVYAGGLVGQTSGGVTISYSSTQGVVEVSGGGGGGGSVSVGGLVGWAGDGATISHSSSSATVTMLNSAGANGRAGGLVGYARRITITSSTFTGTVTGSNFVGGLVGRAAGMTITLSSFTGTVTGTGVAGGLVGHAADTTIASSTSTGTVTGSNYVGGLVGDAFDTTITSSTSTGSVIGSGTSVAAGLVGYASRTTITSSSSTGNVTTPERGLVGGLVGKMWESSLSDSYALGDVRSGTNLSSTVVGNYIAGGLVGDASDSTVERSFAEGVVVSSGVAGGLIGSLIDISYIEGSYSSGDVYGGVIAGGLVGSLEDSYTRDCYATGDVFAMEESDPSAVAGGIFGHLYISQSSITPNVNNTLLFAYGDAYSVATQAGGLFGSIDVNLMPNYVAAINRSVGSKSGSDNTVGRIMGKYVTTDPLTLTHEVYSSKFTKFSGSAITSSVGATMIEAGGVIINGFTLPKEMNDYNEAFYKGMFNDYYRSVSLPSPTMWVFPADVAGNMRIMHEWQIVGKLSYHADDGRKQLLNGRRLKVTNPNAVTGADINYYVKDGYSIKAEVGGIEEDLQINNNIATYTPAFDSVNKDVEYIINVYDSAGELAISLNERYTIVKEGEVPVFPTQ